MSSYDVFVLLHPKITDCEERGQGPMFLLISATYGNFSLEKFAIQTIVLLKVILHVNIAVHVCLYFQIGV